MTESTSIDREAMGALRLKLHGRDKLTSRERLQLSGLLAVLDLQVEIAGDGLRGEASAWREIRESIARKFPLGAVSSVTKGDGTDV